MTSKEIYQKLDPKGGIKPLTHTGSPEGSVSAPIGTMLVSGSDVYFKSTEISSNTGWINLTGALSSINFPGKVIHAFKSNVSGALPLIGGEHSETTYANLFAVVGTRFNLGNESSGNFRLPDVRGRVLGYIGQGSSLTNRSDNDKIGTETETLSINQIPSHKHDLTMTFHASSGGGYNGGRIQLTDRTSASALNPSEMTMANTGGGQSHNNMQPTIFAGNLFVYI